MNSRFYHPSGFTFPIEWRRGVSTGTGVPKIVIGLAMAAGFLAHPHLATAKASPLVMTTAARMEIEHDAFLASRREKLAIEFDPYDGPPVARVVEEMPDPWKARRYPWRYQIRATIFWVGEKATARNPVSNIASSWDPNWQANFGGYDHPFKRSGYRPAAFEPKMNPFYVALPYNDLDRNGRHRPETSEVIPWYWKAYRGPSISLCENRWVAIHHNGRVCYAQWQDVGPFSTDDYAYVFQGQRPRPNPNGNAGIDLSPAVRDFLGLRDNALVDWRFVEDYEVVEGPWAAWRNSATPDLPTKRGP